MPGKTPSIVAVRPDRKEGEKAGFINRPSWHRSARQADAIKERADREVILGQS